jgi:hypothetical protein|tara:strand:+ start:215 stop:424 length:210 start_codon:yes stop_codon:yes gene_type:complete
MSDRLKKLVEENLMFKELVKYTQQDLDDLFFEYDRMSSSGKETLDRLAKMYALDYNKSDAKEIRNALFK